MTIAVGAEAPDFELPSSTLENDRPGKKYRLSDYRGQVVVLCFYPLDFSPVCSTENACLRDDLKGLEDAGARVFGVSVDSHWTHLAFARHLSLAYPLLADFHPKGAVADKYGLYLQDKGFTSRATVIIGKDGRVSWVKVQGLGEARSDAEILEAVRALG
ncbi:MAG: redoxin domain-containing protein [Deltaproteobacteria bacterium]|nr:redoxin domain-containing protein [Deltaproteobacteria bacterium]